jgi:hypothetical protein
MAKVFVVTRGDYSDYHVVAIFSVRESADKLAAIIGGDVELFALDPVVTERTEDPFWKITDFGNGVTQVLAIERDGIFNEKALRPRKASWSIWKGQPPYLAIFCYAAAESHALRIFADIRAYIDTAGLWDVLAACPRNCLRSEDVSTAARDSLEGLLAAAPEASEWE